MNKQQEYFEKNVVPYRQKIRELESENNQLHRDKAILRVNVEALEYENERLQVEIKSISELANMTPEDRKSALARSKSLTMLNDLLNSFSNMYR
jgi:regulator of replication initiation timing